MKILVCGGRDFDDWGLFSRTMVDVLNQNCTAENKPHFISGGARGADSMIIKMANAYNYPVDVYMADWKKYFNAAGPIRNQQMLDEGKPDLVVAFPGGKGTAHMMKIARKAGVKVIEIKES